MSPEETHLSFEQIEWLSATLQSDSHNNAQFKGVEEASRHLAICEACQGMVSMHKEFEQTLRQPGPEVSTSRECPTAQSLRELAAGLTNREVTEKLLRHASQCDHCGPVLRNASEAFNQELKDDEAELISSLQTSEPEWQVSLARRLAAEHSPVGISTRSAPGLKVFPGFPIEIRRIWVYALAAVTVTAAITIGSMLWRSQPSFANRLLAQAYTEHRTLEVRIPGARYAPMRVERGEGSSALDKPTSLLKAETLIGENLRKNPNDAKWLEARARADLLDGNYESAIKSLQRALDLQPDSPYLLTELGSAYFQRAERDKAAIDYGRAYECLSKSLAKRQNDPLTLFNRAIVSERAQLYAQAQEDWKRYLDLGVDLEWGAEARARSAAVEQKLQQKKTSQRAFDSPEQVVAALSSGQEDRISDIDSAADSYLQIAVEEWIPQLTAGHLVDSKKRVSLENALHLLAEDLRTHHQDSWLRDFISNSSVYSASRGTPLLIRAIQASDKGDQESAIRFATAADTEFRKRHNVPGHMRASFQLIYANRLAAHGDKCHKFAELLLKDVDGRNYAWIEIQTQLEAAACAMEMSRLDESLDRSQRALGLAKSARYVNLELRATMFVADPLTDPRMKLNVLRDGLLTFWSGRYDPMRGYSFYAAIDYTNAEELELWYFDEAVIKEGLRLIESDPDLALLGLEHYRLARAQIITDETIEAGRTTTEARTLFSKSTSPALNTAAAIDLADAFLVKGRYRDALDLLSSIEPRLSSFSHDIELEKFYATEAMAFVGEGQNDKAERALITALKVAHKALGSLSDERDRLSWMQALGPVHRSLAYLQSKTDVQSSFRWWESFKGESFARTGGAARGIDSIVAAKSSLPSFNNLIPDHALFLSYATFPDGMYVWAFDGETVRGMRLPKLTSDIARLVDRFREGCADPNSDSNDLLADGRKLYDLFFAPTIGWLEGKSHLIIETDASLEFIPFEAFVDNNGKYIADSYQMDYSPGLLYLSAARNFGRISHKSHVLIIGQSEGDIRNGLSPLLEAADEARDIAKRFDDSVLLLDSHAKFATVVKELPGAEVFHFAGHAIANRNLNGLLMAIESVDDARFLDSSSFNSRLLAASRLIVLSACSTANGRGTGLNDSESLARSALAAGVPNVVASRWAVDSLATHEWMDHFYTVATEGGTVSSAAQQARLAVKAKPEWRHPFYWASFSVFV